MPRGPLGRGRHGGTLLRHAGSGQACAAFDTVPFALWAAACSPDDFAETFWRTVAGLGDRDTTCAIACSVTAARVGPEGIPLNWLLAREPLPSWVPAIG